MVPPVEQDTLLLILNDVYIRLNLSTGKLSEQAQFKDINPILHARFSENSNYMIEIRQFKGVQIWNTSTSKVILFNFDEKFDLSFQRNSSEEKHLKGQRNCLFSGLEIECLQLKEGKQSILV